MTIIIIFCSKVPEVLYVILRNDIHRYIKSHFVSPKVAERRQETFCFKELFTSYSCLHVHNEDHRTFAMQCKAPDKAENF